MSQSAPLSDTNLIEYIFFFKCNNVIRADHKSQETFCTRIEVEVFRGGICVFFPAPTHKMLKVLRVKPLRPLPQIQKKSHQSSCKGMQRIDLEHGVLVKLFMLMLPHLTGMGQSVTGGNKSSVDSVTK